MTVFSKWPWNVVPAFALSLLVAVAALAQEETGGLYGTVIVEVGEPLPGATVSLDGLGATQLQVSDTQGRFRFLGLDPGLYRLTASLEGFSTVEYAGIDIRAGRNTTIELELPAAIGEIITVTTEGPLLDERKVTQGSILTQTDLEVIPTARDPWSLLNQAPGVLVDRINIGGNESGQQSFFSAPGAQFRDNQFVLDGIEVTDLNYVGSSLMYYDFDQFTQVELSTGGTEITKLSPGVSVNMVTKRGTNELRGSARWFTTDPDGYLGILKQSEPDIDPDDLGPGQNPNEIVGNQSDGVDEYGLELGGPAWRDRIWLWGAWSRNDIRAVAANGQSDPVLLEHGAFKVNARASDANSLVGLGNVVDKTWPSRGTGPGVEWEATWNQLARFRVAKLEDTHVFGGNLFLSLSWSWRDFSGRLIGNGGEGLDAPEILWDDDGVWKQNAELSTAETTTQDWKVDGSSFLPWGSVSHELKFGARYRAHVAESQWALPGRQLYHFAAENVGFPPGIDFVIAHRSEILAYSQQQWAVWLQDTATFGSWTLNGGLRFDLQQGDNDPTYVPPNPAFPELLPPVDFPGNDGGGFDWDTTSPRFGATYALGEERRTLLRASYARFVEQLGGWDTKCENPLQAGYCFGLFLDGNDNNMWDGAEIDGWPLFDDCSGDPAEDTYFTDPSLNAATTDEILLGLEHALRPELVAGFNLSWRHTTGIRDDLLLGEETETGLERPVTRDDYSLVTTLEGEMPDGRPYAADFYELDRTSLREIGELRTNADREREYLGATLSLTKRLANQWMLRGYLNYGSSTWKVPESWSFHDDPTADRSRDDQDGELFMQVGKWGEVWLQANWAFNLNGMYQVAPERLWGFNIAGNFYGREGYPLPYFVTYQGKDAATGRSDDFRTQDIYTLDLRLEKEVNATDSLSLVFGIDAFNVFNENYVLRRELQLNFPRGDYLNETLAPRIYRLSLRANWR